MNRQEYPVQKRTERQNQRGRKHRRIQNCRKKAGNPDGARPRAPYHKSESDVELPVRYHRDDDRQCRVGRRDRGRILRGIHR